MKESFSNGLPDGKKMEQAIFGPAGIGEDSLTAGFDPATVQELKGFVNALKVQQAKMPDGVGTVWIQLAQATAAVQAMGATASILGLTTGNIPLSTMGATVMFGPPVISRIMSSPGGIKFLTEGLKTSMKTKKGIQIATQLAKILEAEIPRTTPDQLLSTDTAPPRGQMTMPTTTMEQ